MHLTLDFTEINMGNLPQVGGKNASLGEMITNLSELDLKVPKGFATTAKAYKEFLCSNDLKDKIYTPLKNLDVNDISKLEKVSADIQKLIVNAKFSKSFEEEIEKAYRRLNLDPQHTVAVRSSATAEDLPEASFAGLQETFHRPRRSGLSRIP